MYVYIYMSILIYIYTYIYANIHGASTPSEGIEFVESSATPALVSLVTLYIYIYMYIYIDIYRYIFIYIYTYIPFTTGPLCPAADPFANCRPRVHPSSIK